MKGHLSIIKMRESGLKPSLVFINDFPSRTDWEAHNDHPLVEISPDEQPEWLDLRFLFNLRVSVTGSTEKRAQRLFEACKKAGAVTVAACHVDNSVDNIQRVQVRWCEIWHKVA